MQDDPFDPNTYRLPSSWPRGLLNGQFPPAVSTDVPWPAPPADPPAARPDPSGSLDQFLIDRGMPLRMGAPLSIAPAPAAAPAAPPSIWDRLGGALSNNAA